MNLRILLFLFILMAPIYSCKKRISKRPTIILDDGKLLGKKLYIKNGCDSCHGKSGRGDGPVGKALNPPPSDFRNLDMYKQGYSYRNITHTILTGIPGTLMVGSPLSKADRRLIAGYIIYLQSN